MHTRSLAAALVASATLGALAAVGALPLAAQEDARATRTPRPTPSATPGCVVTATHKADPARLAVGEETTVTVRLQPTCSKEWYPLHIVLVMDATVEVEPESVTAQLNVVEEFADGFLDPADPHRRIGLVAYGDQVRFRCPLTADRQALETCRLRLRALYNRRRGEPNRTVLTQAITDAAAVLRRGRVGYSPGTTRDIIVVFAAGPGPGVCDRASFVARRARSEGILIMSVCAGSRCDAACMRQLASSPRYFFQIDNFGSILQSFVKIHDEVLNIALKRLTLTYVPAEGLRIVPDSAEPAATVMPDGNRLDWWTNYIPRDGVTATFRLVPGAAGRLPLAREAGGTWLDNQNRPGAFAVPPAEVEVLAPVIPR